MTPQHVSPGYWNSRRLSYGWKRNVCVFNHRNFRRFVRACLYTNSSSVLQCEDISGLLSTLIVYTRLAQLLPYGDLAQQNRSNLSWTWSGPSALNKVTCGQLAHSIFSLISVFLGQSAPTKESAHSSASRPELIP